MSTMSDLEVRVEARRQELIEQLRTLKNSTQEGAATARDAIRKRLSEVAHVIKEGVVDGWDSIGDVAKKRITLWLDN